MKERVVMLAQSYYDKDPRVRRQAEALIDHGYEVDVIALRHNRDRKIDELNNVRIYQIPIKKRRGGVTRYFFEYLSFFIFSFFVVTFLYFKKRYRICHVHNMPNFLVFAALIPKLCGATVILDVHDPMPELFSILYTNIKSLITLIKVEEKVSLKFANHVITTTEFIKLNLMQRGSQREKISVIMNLPDTRLFNRQIDCNASANNKTDFVLLFAGTVSKRNGLSNVISAMPLLKEKIPNIKFRIIGTGEYVDDLKKLVAQLQLLHWVLFDKPVPLTQIPAEILLSDAVIWLPTKNEFTDIVMSTKTLEALIMGKPVITTRTTCHDYYFGREDVIYIDPVNTENIVHTIVNLYEDLDKRNYFFDNSVKIASKFSWDFEKQRYFELLDRLNHRKKY